MSVVGGSVGLHPSCSAFKTPVGAASPGGGGPILWHVAARTPFPGLDVHRRAPTCTKRRPRNRPPAAQEGTAEDVLSKVDAGPGWGHRMAQGMRRGSFCLLPRCLAGVKGDELHVPSSHRHKPEALGALHKLWWREPRPLPSLPGAPHCPPHAQAPRRIRRK